MKGKYLCLLLILFALWAKGDEHDFDFQYWTEHGYKFSIGPVTPEQAKQAIINWAGRQNLEIELAPIYYWMEPEEGRLPSYKINPGGSISPELTSWYAFGVEDPNPDHKYTGTVYVDSYTGQIKGITKGWVVRDSGSISDMLPPQQAINVMRNIVASYFPDVPIYSMDLPFLDDYVTEDGSSWKTYEDVIYLTFAERTFTPDGKPVWIYTKCVDIAIDSQTGELQEMFRCYEPLEISPIPSLTYDEMAQAVTSYLYGLGATYVEILDIGGSEEWRINREEPYGPQRLYTNIEVYIEGIPSLPDGNYFGYVDGHTGEIFNAHQSILGIALSPSTSEKPSSLSILFNGRKVKTSSPPIIQKGKVYISVEDVKKMGFNLKKEKKWQISYKNKRATVEDGEIMSKGKTKYILGTVLGRLEGVITRYNKNSNKFYILILNEKAFKKGREERLKLKGGALNLYLAGSLVFSSFGYAVWKFMKLLS